MTENHHTTGFASPAMGYENATIDLNSLLITNPAATYLYRLESAEMAACGIPKGATLIVDRSRTPTFNNPVIIQHEGEFLCRLLTEQNGRSVFTNGKTSIEAVPNETQIIGVVTAYFVECCHDNAH